MPCEAVNDVIRPVAATPWEGDTVGFLNELIEAYRTGLERQRNRSFMHAAMAGAALVCVADGAVSLRQRTRLDRLLDTLEALQVYDPHECVERFNDFVNQIREDPQKGRQRAMQALLAETQEHPESARTIVRICLAVGEVDGRVAAKEQREITRLCRRIGVAPAAVGLVLAGVPPDTATAPGQPYDGRHNER